MLSSTLLRKRAFRLNVFACSTLYAFRFNLQTQVARQAFKGAMVTSLWLLLQYLAYVGTKF